MDDNGEVIVVEEQKHCNAWIKIVSSSLKLTFVVETILNENPSLCTSLSKTTDSTGRSALDVAIPECRTIILFSLYFFKRYEILTTTKPHYQSLTCIVHIAIDHSSETTRQVALKFMKNKDSFLNEIAIRQQAKFESQYVIDLLDYFNSDTDEEFMKCVIQKGFASHPYLIAMSLADRNLNEIVTNGELVDQTDMHFIRNAVVDIARCLSHLHSRNFIHGDLKPKNIMRSEGSFLLIDLDGSAEIGPGFAGMKISSAYSPPELVFRKENTDEYGMKQYNMTIRDSQLFNYPFLSAHPSQDAWSLGMVVYYLVTNITFFPCDSVGENIYNSKDLKNLFEFPDYLKQEMLLRVSDLQLRNLLSNLLNKDPLKRPTMTQVLSHPFLTGKVPSRMIGEKPEFDVFLSYRVASDSHHVKIFYDLLTEKGLKVWWDSKCLEFGKPWEEGFVD